MAILWSESTTEDSDWIKTLSWDLPSDPQAFIASLRGRSLESFMALPAAQAMPDSLREALGELGYSTVLKYAVGQPRNRLGQFASTDGGGGGNSPFIRNYDGETIPDEQPMVDYAIKEQGEYGTYLASDPAMSKSITNYMTEGYYDVLNAKLRNNEDLTEEEQQDAENLFMASMHEEAVFSTDATLWRGVQDTNGTFEQLKVGQTFADNAIVSTSMNPLVADSFASKYAGEGDGYLMKINLPKGMHGLALESSLKGFAVFGDTDKEMYGFSVLNEVLLPSGTVFKVESIEGNQISLNVVKQDDIFS